MSGKPEKSSALGRNVLVAAVVILGIVALLFYSDQILTQTTTTTSSSQKCTVIDSGDIGLTVLNSSNGKPISGLTIGVKEYTPMCATVGSGPYFNLGSMTTDSNGTIMTGGLGTFSFNFSEGGVKYNVTGEALPMSLTCLAYYIPSDRLTNMSTMIPNSPYSCSQFAIQPLTGSQVNSTGILASYYCPTLACEAIPTTTLPIGGSTIVGTISGASNCIPPVQCALPVSLSSSSPNIVPAQSGIIQLMIAFSLSETAPGLINSTLFQVCANSNQTCVVNNLAFGVTFNQQVCTLQQSFNVCIYSSSQISVPSVSQTNHYASLSVIVQGTEHSQATYEIATP